MSLSSSPIKRLLGQPQSLHVLFGAGKAADIILWRDKRRSSAILLAISLSWLLFQSTEYSFVSLLCHISITAMLLIFIWSNGAALLGMPAPKIPELFFSEATFTKAAIAFRAKLLHFLSALHDIACGKNLKSFLLTVLCLWIISVFGSWCGSVNLLFFALVCLLTLPALYERYEHEVDYLAIQGARDLKKLFNNFQFQVMEKIPRGPPKKKET